MWAWWSATGSRDSRRGHQGVDRTVIQTCVIHYSDTWVMPTFLTLPLVAAVPAEQMSA